MLAAAQQWGSIPTWALLVVALVAAWRVSRSGGTAAVGELAEANRVLVQRLKEEREAKEQLGSEVRDLRVELGELRGRTDFAAALAAALAPILEWTAGHEKRAQERHDGMMQAMGSQLGILEQIGNRLGPEPWNGDERRAA